jgi:hypothetical protein
MDAPDPAPTTSQFTRLMPGTPLQLSNGADLPVGCYAVKRKKVNYYMAISADAQGDPPTSAFHRYTGRNGLDDWEDAGFVTGIDIANFTWMDGFLCPDFHFEGPTSSNMTMFFTAGVDPQAPVNVNCCNGTIDTCCPPAPGKVVMRATSADDGASWSVDPDPVVEGDGVFYPYMPSYVEFQGRHLLAVAWCCLGGATHPEIRVYESANGVDNWYSLATAVTQGDCTQDDWDDGNVNRPRMIVDPTGTKILMFYSAYTWDGTTGLNSRKSASIGLAVSANGCDWAVADVPIHAPTNVYPPNPGVDPWDWKTTIIPSVTYADAAKTKLRLYYVGRGAGVNGAIDGAPAAAQRLFSELELPECPSTQPCWSELGQPPVAPQVELSDLGRAQITANPNPTTGSVAIGLDLSRVRKVGNVDVAIFDVTGRAVRTLWEGATPSAPSTIQWDGRESSGSRVSAGNYLVRVRVAGEIVGTHLITHIR